MKTKRRKLKTPSEFEKRIVNLNKSFPMKRNMRKVWVRILFAKIRILNDKITLQRKTLEHDETI